MQPVQSGLIKIMDEQIRVNMKLSHGKKPDLFCIWKDRCLKLPCSCRDKEGFHRLMFAYVHPIALKDFFYIPQGTIIA
jgi:uncharacterized membrane protein